jgi:hypothetical protein
MMTRQIATAALALAALAFATAPAAQTKNGFDLRGALVDPAEILSGGPPKDGIPAIDRPRFVKAGEAKMSPGERILGVERNGEAKAYPVRILNWHEVVNDSVGGTAVAVTYCPLCGSGVTFDRTVLGKERSFGVSGLLYNSDVLLYDRETNSLWSQILGKAVTGPAKGAKLPLVATAHTSWADWVARHPDTLVLSEDTGFTRDYARDPYAGYDANPVILFPVANSSSRFDNKDVVLGIEVDGSRKAYPFRELAKTEGVIGDKLAGRDIRVSYDAQHRTARVLDKDGEELPSVMTYWFAWYAFYPGSAVFYAKQEMDR